MFLYGLVILVHVIVCIMLIAVILLQAGRGGGLSEAFGGESSQTIFGTKTSVFLTRATIVAAGLFLVTSLLLGILTSRRGRSLIDLEGRGMPVTVPAMPGAGTQIPEGQAVKEKAIDTEEIPLAEPEKLPTK